MSEKYLYQESESNEEILVKHIPFKVQRENRVITELGSPIPFHGRCEALLFLGMATRAGEGSEWWGPYERNYDHTKRLFFGDRIGQIHVVYEDDSQEMASVIFGVNAWIYDLFEPVKDWEKDNVKPWFGPHREPFASDPEAEKLRRAALHMIENDGDNAEKGSKWIFCFRTRPEKTIKEIVLEDERCKRAGFVVSAVTGLRAGEKTDSSWPVVDADFFARRDYAGDVDRLSRRLYQYEDDLPEEDTLWQGDGFDAPDIRFSGCKYAGIMTNVYRANIMDMAYDKVDDSGRTHTSSKGAPYFGCYMGFGTWVPGQGSYYNEMWSRDVGRTITEVAHAGYLDRVARCVEDLHVQLYNPATRYQVPNWKRIANLTEANGERWLSVQCKENDGHAALMIAIYTYYRKSGVGRKWLEERRKPLYDAVNWIFWQMENPEESNFDRVLYSESEASNQSWGGYDLFSNAQCIFGLCGYAMMFDDLKERELAERCRAAAGTLWKGCLERFGQKHFKYGLVLTDTTDDGWTWEYKRFAPLFLMADIFGYDVRTDNKELFDLMDRTFSAQKDEYYAPEAGRQMGYGQGYLTEAAILLDRYDELTECAEAAAKFCYHHTDHPYIVPEGVVLHGSKRCWFRNSDLGNAVQQGEIIKVIRLLIGIDDLSPDRGLRLIPRLPDTFDTLEAKQYPVLASCEEGKMTVAVDMSFKREDGGYRLTLNSAHALHLDQVRVGPFSKDREIEHILCSECSGSREEIIAGRKFVYLNIGKEVAALDIKVE